MRIKDMTAAQVRELIETNLQNGINVFDHADIYGGGECEIAFEISISVCNPTAKELSDCLKNCLRRIRRQVPLFEVYNLI